jgi:membrane protein
VSWTKDVLEPIIDDLSNGLGELFGLKLTTVLESPSAFNANAWGYVTDISGALLETGAVVVLLILSVLEMHRIALVTDGDGETRLRMIIFTLIKFGFMWALFKQTPVVLDAIYQFGSTLASGANSLVASGSWSPKAQDEFFKSVEKMDWLGQTVLVVLMLIAWLVNKGAVLGALALVVMRFIKLYIYGAFAPVSMALLTSEHTRSFGIGFLRNYASTVLQSFVLVLMFGLYALLTKSWAGKVNFNPAGGLAAAFTIGGMYIFLGILLVMLVMGSGKIASELLGG